MHVVVGGDVDRFVGRRTVFGRWVGAVGIDGATRDIVTLVLAANVLLNLEDKRRTEMAEEPISFEEVTLSG
jgi:hypothetical protein